MSHLRPYKIWRLLLWPNFAMAAGGQSNAKTFGDMHHFGTVSGYCWAFYFHTSPAAPGNCKTTKNKWKNCAPYNVAAKWWMIFICRLGLAYKYFRIKNWFKSHVTIFTCYFLLFFSLHLGKRNSNIKSNWSPLELRCFW